MKPLSEISSRVASDMQDTLSAADTRQNIAALGSTLPAGATITTARPAFLPPEDVPDILSMLSCKALWQIKPTSDPRDVQNALHVLELALLPATREQAAYWVGRLLAHFPRRDVTKDQIVISDLASDLIDAGCSQVGIASVCRELRQEADNENPFMPPAGEVLRRAKDRDGGYRFQRRTLLREPASAPEGAGVA